MMETKACTKCGETKALDDFYKDKCAKGGRSSACRECIQTANRNRYYAKRETKKAASRAYRKANPDKVRSTNLRIYGLNLDGYNAILAAQGGNCAICGTSPPDIAGGSFCVDHDHTTGKVRGVLCRGCNSMLGHARDNVEILAASIRYLRRAT